MKFFQDGFLSFKVQHTQPIDKRMEIVKPARIILFESLLPLPRPQTPSFLPLRQSDIKNRNYREPLRRT